MEVRRERLRIVNLPSTGRPCPLAHVALPPAGRLNSPGIAIIPLSVTRVNAGDRAFRRSGVRAFRIDMDKPVFDSASPESPNAGTHKRLNAQTPERLSQMRGIVIEGERRTQRAEN